MNPVRHMNFGWLHAPPFPPAACHCLLIQTSTGIALVDTGIGMHDIADPVTRIGQAAIAAAGFQFIPSVTALVQLAYLGIQPEAVTDVVLTHCDPDHVGGLADFPQAQVHLSAEEKANLDSGCPRYSPTQFSHHPKFITYASNDSDFFGLPSRKVETSLELDIRLVPLFGHTLGHCGVAIECAGHWTLHVGDAYYLRDELFNLQHPVDQLATLRADDNELRVQSLNVLRQLVGRTDIPLSMCGYHDLSELPPGIPSLNEASRQKR